jgi:chromosome segregation ATPase
VESPQSQPSAPAVQVLRQRLLQIVEVQRALQERNDERGREVESAVAALHSLTSQGNKMVDDADKLRQARDQLVQERDQLAQARDQLVQERDQLRQEKDQLVQERDQLHVNNNDLASHHQNLSEQFEALQREHNSLCDHLKQHPLLEEMSQSNGSLVASLDQLLSERQQWAEKCKTSHEECEQLRNELKRINKQYRDTLQAFIHVFPSEIYHAKRPDLNFLTDVNKLLEHFISNGINEGISLDYTTLREEIVMEATEANKTLQAKLNELELLVCDSSKRLSFIHDLFVRISLEGNVR